MLKASLLGLLFLSLTSLPSSLQAETGSGKYRPEDYYDCVDEIWQEPNAHDFRIVTDGKQIFLLKRNAIYFFERTLLNHFGVHPVLINGKFTVHEKDFAVVIEDAEKFVRATRAPVDPVLNQVIETFSAKPIETPRGAYQTVTPQLLQAGSSSPTLNLWISNILPKTYEFLDSTLNEELREDLNYKEVLSDFDKKILALEKTCGALGSDKINSVLSAGTAQWEQVKESALNKLNESF